MKSFEDYLQEQSIILEDFNSKDATQFLLKVGPRTLPVFYEKLAKRPFNLVRYLKSFDSDLATSTLNLTAYTNHRGHAVGNNVRGLIYSVGSNYHIFVFLDMVLHVLICLALDQHPGKYPGLEYSKIYNESYDIEENDPVPNQWCFPYIYDSGVIKTNLKNKPFEKMCSVIDLEKQFMINKSDIITEK